jgi:hypothetical protein
MRRKALFARARQTYWNPSLQSQLQSSTKTRTEPSKKRRCKPILRSLIGKLGRSAKNAEWTPAEFGPLAVVKGEPRRRADL